ncbi:MAG: hypothetical protein KJZ70_06175 [Bryobacterales bacterium]|nr:hypothetical protein [Bryobacterales bacterium]
MRIIRTLFLATALVAHALAGELFSDDFSRFPAGLLTSPVGALNAAIQEYHYMPNRGVPLGPWDSAISHMDAWLVSSENGKPFLEQHLTPRQEAFSSATAIFLTGEPEWSDYTVEVKVKPLAFDDVAGVVFRYHTNMHYYRFGISGGNRAVLSLHMPLEKAFRVRDVREIASAEFHYDTDRYYTLRVENSGPSIRAFVDGKLVLEASSSELLQGKTGVTAAVPARFQDFRVSASDETEKKIAERIRQRNNELERLRAENPQPKLWKKFETPGYGAGRNVRFGDLNGDGVIDMLIGQNIPQVRGDAFDSISCLTAVDLDGKILWQSGRPDPRNGLLTNDTPFQIHDVDGDGRNEVVLIRDFQLQILDGSTGKLRKWAWMPKAPPSRERPFERVNGDSIAFVNLSGNPARHEILVKDRYDNFWVFNNSLEMLWTGSGQLGHYPYPFPSEGRDLIAIGYALWDHTGKQLWSNDRVLHDHSDAVMMGNLSGDPNAEPRIYSSGSDEGFLMFDRSGKLLKHVRVGHNQSPAVGRFRPDLPGLQYMGINFWRNPGIVTLFDFDGNILTQGEPIHTGSCMLPVNWRGDGQEFVFLSGGPKQGGMIDGHLRRVVMFPDDGHPALAASVLNLTGDARDEIVLWDEQRVWIYTQDRPFEGKRIYAPIRNPDYNESNYRANVSFPNWEDTGKK